MRTPPAHIAGIGTADRTDLPFDQQAVSAATKALLDAGLTYSDVDQSVACFLDEQTRIPRSSFNAFGKGGAPVYEVDNHAALFTAVQGVKSGHTQCVLVVGVDKDGSSGKNVAVAVVLVSTLFLTSHAYLKDSSVCVLACSLGERLRPRSNASDTIKTAVKSVLRHAQLEAKDIQVVQALSGSDSNAKQALSDFKSSKTTTGTTGLLGLSELVLQLRGWAHDRPFSKVQNCLQYTADQDGSASLIVLSRSDGREALAWEDVQNVRDGRERLGYNPATDKRAIAHEDLNSVMAREENMSDDIVKRLRLRIKGGDRAALARL